MTTTHFPKLSATPEMAQTAEGYARLLQGYLKDVARRLPSYKERMSLQATFTSLMAWMDAYHEGSATFEGWLVRCEMASQQCQLARDALCPAVNDGLEEFAVFVALKDEGLI